jgi:hypothetical protein
MVKAKMEPAHAVTLDKHAGGHWRAVDAAQVHVGPAGLVTLALLTVEFTGRQAPMLICCRFRPSRCEEWVGRLMPVQW